jgi:quinol monooxygenase YgiN
MTDPGFAINVRFSVKKERKDEFLAVMRSNMNQTMNKEPNALQFVIGQDVDDNDSFYLHEEYRSRKDHSDPHSKTEYYNDCMTFFATNPFTEPHQADEFVLLHEAPSEKIIPSLSSLSSGIFCVNARLCIRPELREEFVGILANLKRHANDQGDDNEQLCIQFSYGESIHTPHTFHVHEQYVGGNGGLEGFLAHETSLHLEPCRQFIATKHPFTEPPVMHTYRLFLS